jgi:predicted PurR-regulated permease PerM
MNNRIPTLFTRKEKMEKPDSLLQTRTLTVVRFTAVLLSVVIVASLLKLLQFVLQPLFIAAFLYFVSHPIRNALKKRHVPGFLAALLPALLALLLLSGLGWAVIAGASRVADDWPSYAEKFQSMYQALLSWTQAHVPGLGERLTHSLSPKNISLEAVGIPALSIFGNFFHALSTLAMVVVYLIFIHNEAASLPRRLASAYGKERADEITKIGHKITGGIVNYVYVKSIVSLVSATLSTAVCFFFGLDMALLWGAMIFFGNFIPLVGSFITNVFPFAFALMQFDNPLRAVWMVAALVALQETAENFLQPALAGKRLNLSPLFMIVFIAVWTWLWGLVGILLAVPILVSLKFVLENVSSTRSLAVLIGGDKS